MVRVGDKLRLRPGDRFVADWTDQAELAQLYCEVVERTGKTYQCFILNGFWTLRFNLHGEARHNGRLARVRLLLPTKLTRVADMGDSDRVLTVAERQLRKAAKG